MPEDQHGGRLVAQALKREGIETIFTLCGGHIMNIYEGCLDEGIRVVDVRHEQAAAMAADGLARMTRRPQFATVTAGPGVMNAVTGIANARAADSPVVLLGGQSDFARFGQGALQEGPQVEVLAPLTKYAKSCYDINLLSDHMHSAFRAAATPRMGPAFLEVPWDILFEEGREWAAPGGHGATRTVYRTHADPGRLTEAIQLLREAERPVIVAGAGLWWDHAEAALQAFMDAYEAPIYTSSLARGMMPMGHARFFVHSRSKALDEADVVLNLGTPFDFRLAFGESVNKNARIIHADTVGNAIGRRPVDVGLVGDLSATLQHLSNGIRGLPAPDRTAWLAGLREHDDNKRAKNAELANQEGDPMPALRFLRALNDIIDDDTLVIGDGGNIVALAGKVLEINTPGNWLDPGPYGTLGVGLPFGMAAKIAHPAKKIIVLSGDGAFGLNGMEIESCVRQDLPVTVVVANDGAWNQIRDPQVTFYGEERAIATGLDQRVRYSDIATAVGGYGERVSDAKEVGHAIERAHASGKAAVIDVPIDPATNKGSGKPM